MGFDEGVILLNSGTYIPGQIMYGRLEFDLEKDKKFRGIYADIIGKCKVHWTTSHSRRVNDRTEHYTVTHESHEEYINTTIYLIGSKHGETVLHPGRHVFPFECQIPPNCPSSFEGSRGSIRYKIKVTVDRAFKLDQTKVLDFRVEAPLDLNTNPEAKEPIAFDFEQTYCCWCTNAGVSETIVKLPASGFCPKQIIPIEVACNNNSTVDIDTIKFSILGKRIFIAAHEPDTWAEEEEIATLKKGPIPGNTTRNWTVEMEVPDFEVYNLLSCRYISNDYTFKVEIGTSGCHTDEDDSHRIFFGTIPLASLQYPPNSNFETPNLGVTSYPAGLMVNQPLSNNASYPGANPSYPHATPYYPGGNSPHPGGNVPYPGGIQPYPGNNPNFGFPETSPFPAPLPYPVGPNPPYPAGNAGGNPPYPGRNPPAVNVGSNPPHPNSPYSSNVSGFRAGNDGLMGKDAKESIPLLPPGGMPRPSSPYSSASAPPQTPDDENKKLAENIPPPYPQ